MRRARRRSRASKRICTVRPVRALTLGASYAYTDAKIPPIPNPFIFGNPLFQVFAVYTPKHAASGYADYEIPVDSISGGARSASTSMRTMQAAA